MKRLLICLLVLATVLSAVGCEKRTAMNSPEETFSTPDVSIVLSSAFKTVKTTDYTACFEASDVTVYLIQEKFDDLTEEQARLSVENYAELVRANNASKTPSDVTVSEETGLVTFEYTYEEDGKIYKALSAMYRSTNSFWTIRFVCEEALYESYLPTFTTWAQSVFFTLKDKNYLVDKAFMITLTEGFIKNDLDTLLKENNPVSSTKTETLIANYASDDGKIIINVKKDSKSNAGVKKLNDYTNLVYGKYKQQDQISEKIDKISGLTKEGSLSYFTFEFGQSIPNPNNPQQKPTTQKYTYFVFCLEGGKNLYTVEFACERKSAANYMPTFIKWAQSATFDWTEKDLK